MNRNIFEIAFGIIVVGICTIFFTYIVKTGAFKKSGEYNKILFARFNNIDGIKIGSDVKIGGIKIGSVLEHELNNETFQVNVKIAIKNKLQIPSDSFLSVSSSGIFGAKYLAIKPGFSEEFLANDGYFSNTQSSTNLEDLISKFATSSSMK